VHSIVTQYGGTIDVNSELGTGSTFTVTLPVCNGGRTRD
jgi:signal transduction histidine kinase